MSWSQAVVSLVLFASSSSSSSSSSSAEALLRMDKTDRVALDLADGLKRKEIIEDINDKTNST